ncbi:glycoside hydrolase [Sphingomonas sp. Root50]|nr:glycoside hydrolase [Sphingomonas sp. Root1294]KQY72723.1 glycoside hydrolase [Sphingomonas sp. Root50]KRB87790.1 glycoside hydrolase [Sphingomonas sp. Root720]
MSFEEEFDGSALRDDIWRTAYKTCGKAGSIANRSLYGNRERQIYFDRDFLGAGVQPFEVRDGKLAITARPLSPAVKAKLDRALAKQPANIGGSALGQALYSSGLITTKCSFEQAYGYFEIRARWTGGKGIWPAFWLLPAKGGWPPEIDILEAHGDKPGTVFQSLHSKLQKSITRKVTMAGTADQFHLYAVLWTPERLDYYIDGVRTASIPTTADAGQPMYLLANLAIGGKWPGDPDAGTVMPARMEIDHIRVWRFADRPS